MCADYGCWQKTMQYAIIGTIYLSEEYIITSNNVRIGMYSVLQTKIIFADSFVISSNALCCKKCMESNCFVNRNIF